MLLVGVFLPLVRVPIAGTLNFFQNGQGDGILIFGLAVASILLVLRKQTQYLLLSGGAALGFLIFTVFQFQSLLGNLRRDIDLELEGNPFRGLADAMVGSVQFQWGLGILFLGGGLVFFSGFTAYKARIE